MSLRVPVVKVEPMDDKSCTVTNVPMDCECSARLCSHAIAAMSQFGKVGGKKTKRRYEVKDLVSQQYTHGVVTHYLVEWAGYPGQNTWETVASLRKAVPELVRAAEQYFAAYA